MIGCRYSGSWLDYSGYGSANRADIISLFIAGVSLTTELVVQVAEKTNFGFTENIAKSLQDRTIKYKIKIIHLTPNMYPRYQEEGKYNIGRLFWETDTLPQDWIEPCNGMQEIWTGSERMVKMIKDSGVKVPIYAFPQPCNTMIENQIISPFEMKYTKDFMFYSIFQWIERKNPKTLLTAYWKAFEGNEFVTLLLKTYRVNYSEDEFTRIKEDITKWKKELGLKHYPKIFLVPKLLNDSEMIKLHMTGDCYINSSSGEGWSRPMQEAMLMGKPVISADNGGITDYLTDEYYYRVASTPRKVTEVTWIPWYTKGMNWWEIKEDELIKILRHIYENREQLNEKVAKARQWVLEKTSYQVVGAQLKNRLSEIERIL